ncbi:hypothetical protein U1Q18_006148 [Sarracenia purpurea var. burkii]
MNTWNLQAKGPTVDMCSPDTASAVMTSRESFTIGVQKSPVVPSQPVVQSMRLAYSADGAAVYKPVAGSSPPFQSAASVGGGSGTEGQAAATVVPHNLNVNVGDPMMKKKRGRPRKYGPEGTIALALVPAPPIATGPNSTGAFSPAPHPSGGGLSSPSSSKKNRGRPPGSSKKQQMDALGNN